MDCRVIAPSNSASERVVSRVSRYTRSSAARRLCLERRWCLSVELARRVRRRVNGTRREDAIDRSHGFSLRSLVSRANGASDSYPCADDYGSLRRLPSRALETVAYPIDPTLSLCRFPRKRVYRFRIFASSLVRDTFAPKASFHRCRSLKVKEDRAMLSARERPKRTQ